MSNSEDGSPGSPSDNLKNSPDKNGCWVLKESHLFFPKIWTKRWLRLHDSFTPKLSYSHSEVALPKKQIALTLETLITRKSKKILEIQWSEDGPVYWRLKFHTSKERDRWARTLTDSVESIRWLKQYDIGEAIGFGAMGALFYAKKYDKEGEPQELVLKLIATTDKHSCKVTLNEVHNHQMITDVANHPKILRYHDSFRQAHKTYLVLEYCKGGDLAAMQQKKMRYSEEEAAEVFCSLIDAVKTIHKHGMVHLDIKLANIFLASDDLTDIRIGDFGSSKLLEGRKYLSQSSGTIGFSAPEMLQQKIPTTAADVFSCGVVLYCLLCGDMPFKGYDREVVIKNILAGNYNIANEWWYKVSKSAKSLILAMIEVDLTKRITIPQILEHEWFISHNKGYC